MNPSRRRRLTCQSNCDRSYAARAIIQAETASRFDSIQALGQWSSTT